MGTSEIHDSPSDWVADHIRRYVETGGADGHEWQGGAPEHPQWHLNLAADPEVEVEVADRVFPARARTASPEEKARLWQLMLAEWPDYEQYQARTDRDIPVVVLEPAG